MGSKFKIVKTFLLEELRGMSDCRLSQAIAEVSLEGAVSVGVGV